MSARRKLGEHAGSAADIIHTVEKRGAIERKTLDDLLYLLSNHTDYLHHVTVEVQVNALLKTIDNEADALETIARIKATLCKTCHGNGSVRHCDHRDCNGVDVECSACGGTGKASKEAT